MKSHSIKTSILQYMRFKKLHEYVATECGQYNADVLTSNANELVEYEIKVSKADLKREVHKPKHALYNDPKSRRYWVPNRFYFAIPADLVDTALELIKENGWTKYGIAVYDPTKHISKSITIVKNARRLNESKVHQTVLRKILLRTSSDLVNIYYKTHIEDKMLSDLSQISELNTKVEEPKE